MSELTLVGRDGLDFRWPDDLLALFGYKLVRHLGEMLHTSGLLHAQRQPDRNEVSDQHQEHQQFHRERIGDRGLGRGRVHVQGIQKRRHRRGKVLVQDSGKQ